MSTLKVDKIIPFQATELELGLIKLENLTTLPAGELGYFAVVNSELKFHNGTDWFNILLSGSAPAPTVFFYTQVGYGDLSSTDACNDAGTGEFYSDCSTLGIGCEFYTDNGLTTPVADGFYAVAGNWYQVSGGTGTVTDSGVCPSTSGFFMTYDEFSSTTACENVATQEYYTTDGFLSQGQTLFTDSGLTITAPGGFYAVDGTVYTVDGTGLIQSQESCPQPAQSYFAGFDTTDSNTACAAPTTTEVYNDQNLMFGSFLYTDSGLTITVADGWYAISGQVYRTEAGEIVEQANCPVLFNGFLATNETDACSSMGSSIQVYADNFNINPGDVLYSDSGLTTIAADGWYFLTEDASGRVYLQENGVIVAYFDCNTSQFFTVLAEGTTQTEACDNTFGATLFIVSEYPIQIGTIISDGTGSPVAAAFFADNFSTEVYETGASGDVIDIGNCPI